MNAGSAGAAGPSAVGLHEARRGAKEGIGVDARHHDRPPGLQARGLRCDGVDAPAEGGHADLRGGAALGNVVPLARACDPHLGVSVRLLRSAGQA